MSEGMRTFKLDKLVRDGIVGSTESQGGVVDYEVLPPEDRLAALVAKMPEELAEALTSTDPAKELADAQEILDQIAIELKVTKVEVESAQSHRYSKLGGFRLGHFIRTVSLPAGNRWARYYGSDPKRFPETKN